MNNRVFISEWTPKTRARVEEIVRSNAQAGSRPGALDFGQSTTSSESPRARESGTPIKLLAYKSPVGAAECSRPSAFSAIPAVQRAGPGDLLPDEPSEQPVSLGRPSAFGALPPECTRSGELPHLPDLPKLSYPLSYSPCYSEPKAVHSGPDSAAGHQQFEVEADFLRHFLARTLKYLQRGDYSGAAKAFGLVRRVFELYGGVFERYDGIYALYDRLLTPYNGPAGQQMAASRCCSEVGTAAARQEQCLMEIITRGMESVLCAGEAQQQAHNRLEITMSRLDAAERALDLLALLKP